MLEEITKPETEKRGRGRPKGSGRGLDACQRAINSRTRRKLNGEKRVEVILGEEAHLALRYFQKMQPDATIREIIESALIEAENRNRLR